MALVFSYVCLYVATSTLNTTAPRLAPHGTRGWRNRIIGSLVPGRQRDVLGSSLTSGKEEDPRQGGPCQVGGAGMVFSAPPAVTEWGGPKTNEGEELRQYCLGILSETTCSKGLFYDESTSVYHCVFLFVSVYVSLCVPVCAYLYVPLYVSLCACVLPMEGLQNGWKSLFWVVRKTQSLVTREVLLPF